MEIEKIYFLTPNRQQRQVSQKSCSKQFRESREPRSMNDKKWRSDLPDVCPGTTNLLPYRAASNVETPPGAQSCHQLATGESHCRAVMFSRNFRRSGLSRFQGEWREAQQKFKKLLEAISRSEMTVSEQGGSLKRNSVLLFKARCRTMLNFSW